MRNIFLILIFLFACSDSKEQIVQKEEKFPFSNLSLKEVLNLKSDKIIFLDFYSDTWSGCVLLETETLTNQEVIDFANNHLISIKLDDFAEKYWGEIKQFKSMHGRLISIKNILYCLVCFIKIKRA